MSDDGMWNGGKTNESKDKAIREWNKMIRKSEDYPGVCTQYASA